MYHIVITWIRVENIFPHTHQKYIFESYICVNNFWFIIRSVWDIETNTWEMQKKVRCFARTEGSSICLNYWLQVAKVCKDIWCCLQASGRCTITMSKYLSFNLTLIFQEQYCNKCIFMQSGNFHYLTSGEPTMKSAIGYFQWLQSFQLGTGSNLYIISRRSLGLASIFRFQALAASSTNIFDRKQELGELKPPIWGY